MLINGGLQKSKFGSLCLVFYTDCIIIVRSSEEHEMNRVISAILVVSCLVANAAGTKKKEDFYSQLSRAVIRLEHLEYVKQEGSSEVIKRNKSNGTAFFVQSAGHLFVVSARHVVELPYDLHARVECINKSSGRKEMVLLKLPRKRWVSHPVDGNKDTHPVDVAAMKISWFKGRTITHFRYDLPDSKTKDKNQLPLDDPAPPRKILVFGFPVNIGFELREQRPFGRSGIIAMRTGKKFLRLRMNGENKFVEEKCYLIDAEIFHGNSGSPVLKQPSLTDSKVQLLGLVIASSQKMDFGVVEPVSRIREVLDKAKQQKDENIEYWSLMKK